MFAQSPSSGPRPVKRSRLRLWLGGMFFTLQRFWVWRFSGIRYATRRSTAWLPVVHAAHRSPLIRPLKHLDMWMQHNKVENLKRATARLDGLVLAPGETFSFWKSVGRPSAARGYRPGMVLRNGAVVAGIGGGLCQLTNLIYWMTLHTELTVAERWRHSFDVFPDENRTQPFGTGATCSYNYVDLQVRNDTAHPWQLHVWLDTEDLHGEWRSDAPVMQLFEIVERDHDRAERPTGYSRHNKLYRLRLRLDQPQEAAALEFITENHALMMYSPLLPPPSANL